MDRTILLHKKLSPLSRVFRINYQVLREAQKELVADNGIDMKPQMSNTTWHHGSPASMHGSQSSMASPALTPRHYPTPGPVSAHSSFSG
jgi:hypothetical protein